MLSDAQRSMGLQSMLYVTEAVQGAWLMHFVMSRGPPRYVMLPRTDGQRLETGMSLLRGCLRGTWWLAELARWM